MTCHDNRIYSINENFFNTIDTEEKAYWFGFLCGDGSLSDRDIQLELSVIDKNHIQKFLNSIASEHSVKERKNRPRAYIQLSCQKMYKDLNSLGLERNKSKTINIDLSQISKELHRHFWRGLIDADGSVDLSKDKYPRVRLNGNKMMCTKFEKWCKNITDTSALTNKGNSCYVFCAYGKYGEIVMKELYKDSSIYLERKYKQVSSILGGV